MGEFLGLSIVQGTVRPFGISAEEFGARDQWDTENVEYVRKCLTTGVFQSIYQLPLFRSKRTPRTLTIGMSVACATFTVSIIGDGFGFNWRCTFEQTRDILNTLMPPESESQQDEIR